MTAKTFNAAAYTFDYDAEVAAFYAAWPALKEKVFFIEATAEGGLLYRGQETDEDQIADIIQKDGDLNATIADVYKSGICLALHNRPYSCVILKLPRSKNLLNILGAATPPAVLDAFTFDHECGHILCKGGKKSKKMRENVADAYAVIRHFQRFGADSEWLQKLPQMRTVEAVFGFDGSHFSTPMIEQIMTDATIKGFSHLSPRQTTALATRYAQKYAPDPMLVSHIGRSLWAFNCKASKIAAGRYEELEQLAFHVLETTDPAQFKWGATTIHSLLAGDIMIDGKVLEPPRGRMWGFMTQALDIRAERFATKPARPNP